ncbi:MAG: DUF975 family protein [Oscillospiraceae bacterium]|nr:DUF975 family protein [Oscillospiraceae bacterium]
MKYAADFRSIARNALSGRWGTAVITGVVASILGAIASNGPEINLNFDGNGAYTALEFAGQKIYTTEMGWNSPLSGLLVRGASFVVIAALVMAVAYFILGSITQIGYARFNLDLVDQQNEPEIGALFRYFTNWKTTAAAKLLQWLYVFLWSLLFIIPGIVAGYSYAMTGYILAEHPELTASEAIDRSKQMMYGNRFRLFCLQLSFIGWDMLCTLTFGIGYLWLTPYKQAATAAFYREVSVMENHL